MIAFMLYITDLAGNVQVVRNTALYSPLGFPPAMIKVLGVCAITSANSVSTTNILVMSDGTSYTAPYVWQSAVNNIKV